MEEIKPDVWYKPMQIAKARFIVNPSISTVSSAYNYILKLIKKGILQAKNYGLGQTAYYSVKGSEILRFLKEGK